MTVYYMTKFILENSAQAIIDLYKQKFEEQNEPFDKKRRKNWGTG